MDQIEPCQYTAPWSATANKQVDIGGKYYKRPLVASRASILSMGLVQQDYCMG
jgi:hypothetical protein